MSRTTEIKIFNQEWMVQHRALNLWDCVSMYLISSAVLDAMNWLNRNTKTYYSASNWCRANQMFADGTSVLSSSLIGTLACHSPSQIFWIVQIRHYLPNLKIWEVQVWICLEFDVCLLSVVTWWLYWLCVILRSFAITFSSTWPPSKKIEKAMRHFAILSLHGCRIGNTLLEGKQASAWFKLVLERLFVFFSNIWKLLPAHSITWK